MTVAVHIVELDKLFQFNQLREQTILREGLFELELIESSVAISVKFVENGLECTQANAALVSDEVFQREVNLVDTNLLVNAVVSHYWMLICYN